MMVAITIIFEIPRFALQRYEETEATENSYCYARTLMQKVFLTECEYMRTPTRSDPLLQTEIHSSLLRTIFIHLILS